MTPYEIILILNASCSGHQPYDGRNAPIYAETMQRLASMGLFDGDAAFGYAPTDKLQAYCKFLCLMPLPMNSWSMSPCTSILSLPVPPKEAV